MLQRVFAFLGYPILKFLLYAALLEYKLDELLTGRRAEPRKPKR